MREVFLRRILSPVEAKGRPLSNSTAGRWVGAKDEEIALTFDVAGDLNWLGDEVEDLWVDQLAVVGDEEEVERRTVCLADQQDGWNAAADAADGTRAVRNERTGIHHAEVTFAVHNLARKRLLTEANRWR